MKLQTKFLLFVCVLHGITLVLSFFLLRDYLIVFLASELLILFSIYISWRLYQELIRPLQLLMQGLDAIRERDFNVKFVATGQREMDQLIEVYNSMIDQLRAERTKQEQQHFFLEKLIYTSPTGILILDYEEKIQQVNPKALMLLQTESSQVLGKSLQECTHPAFALIQRLQPGESSTITLNGVNTYKLQKSHFIDRGFPRHFVMIEELTAEILAAEKKAYGKVIRMMAHEVNNTLGAVNSILQSTQALQQSAMPADPMLQDALQIAMDRNQNLNSFMRNFADVVRIPPPRLATIDLNHLVTRVARLMQPRAEINNVAFQWQLQEPSLLILADEQQMEQVLINVIKNAIEAAGENAFIRFSVSALPRQLIIADNGKGISAAAAEQLFSPFYSTKKDGQGIGLTVIREILLNHGFEFSLQTAASGLTEFRIGF